MMKLPHDEESTVGPHPTSGPEESSPAVPESRESGPAPWRILDFQGVAVLIDDAAAAGPRRLATLLRVLRSSEECLEARVVVDLVLRCRDPLAPIATLCRDALQAALDFGHLLRSRTWRRVGDCCPNARATALLNLCDRILADDNPLKRQRRRRCREIRTLLDRSSAEELNARDEDLPRLEAARVTQCPGYRRLLRDFLADVLSTRA